MDAETYRLAQSIRPLCAEVYEDERSRPDSGPTVMIRSGSLRVSPGRAAFQVVLALGLLASASPTWGQSAVPPADEPSHRILLLYSESRLIPSVVNVDQAFRSTLATSLPERVHFYTEFLDLTAFQGDMPRSELCELLRRKYQNRRIYLIVSQGQLTVPLALQIRDGLFPHAPVVLIAVEASAFADLSSGSGVTGTWRRRGWRETLDLGRRLPPGTRRAIVLVGSSVAERLWLESAREQLADVDGAVEIRYLIDWRLEDILDAVAALSTDTVVLTGPFLRDGTGRDFVTTEATRRIAAASAVPVYALTDGVVGSGVVGGHVMDFESHGRVAAD